MNCMLSFLYYFEALLELLFGSLHCPTVLIWSVVFTAACSTSWMNDSCCLLFCISLHRFELFVVECICLDCLNVWCIVYAWWMVVFLGLLHWFVSMVCNVELQHVCFSYCHAMLCLVIWLIMFDAWLYYGHECSDLIVYG